MVATRKIITFKMSLQWFPPQKAKMSTNNKIWHQFWSLFNPLFADNLEAILPLCEMNYLELHDNVHVSMFRMFIFIAQFKQFPLFSTRQRSAAD